VLAIVPGIAKLARGHTTALLVVVATNQDLDMNTDSRDSEEILAID